LYDNERKNWAVKFQENIQSTICPLVEWLLLVATTNGSDVPSYPRGAAIRLNELQTTIEDTALAEVDKNLRRNRLFGSYKLLN